MTVHTFSTSPVKKKADHEAVLAVKEHCEAHRINFSKLVVALISGYKKEKLDDV